MAKTSWKDTAEHTRMIHHGRHQLMKLLSVTTFFSFLIVLPSRGQVDLEVGKLERLEGQRLHKSAGARSRHHT